MFYYLGATVFPKNERLSSTGTIAVAPDFLRQKGGVYIRLSGRAMVFSNFQCGASYKFAQ